MLDNLKLLLLALTLSFVSCDQDNQSDVPSPLLTQLNTEKAPAFDSIKVTTMKRNNIADSTRIVDFFYKEFKYEYEGTFSSDSVSMNNANIIYPTVLHQKFRIYRASMLVKDFAFPFKRIKQELVSMDSVEMTDNVLVNFSIVQTPKGVLLSIYGYGGCNSCSEFMGMYTLTGQVIHSFYGTKYERFRDERNDSLALIYGIDYKSNEKSNYVKHSYSFW